MRLSQDSPLIGVFAILRDWLKAMKQSDFEQSNTVSNNLINEIETIIAA